jgi:hypothetical protein
MTNPTYRPEMLKLLSEEQQAAYPWAEGHSNRELFEELALTHYLLRVAEAQIKLTVTYAEIEGTWDTSDEDAARKVNAELGIS